MRKGRSSVRIGRRATQADSWLRLAGVVLLALKILLLPTVFDPWSDQAFGLAKSVVSRALFYAMLLVLALYLGRRLREVRLSWLWIPAGLYLVVAVIATAFALDPRTALYGAVGRYLGLTSIVDLAAFGLAVGIFVRTSRDLDWLLRALFLGASLSLLYGAVQFAGLDPFRWSTASPFSTQGNSGAFAGHVVVVASVALTVLLMRWRTLSRRVRLWLSALVVAGAATVVIVGTRSATLALPVGIVAALAVARRSDAPVLSSLRRNIGSRRGIAAAAIAFVLVVTLVLISPAGSRLLALARGGDLSSGERALIYSAVVDGISSRPVLGLGPDSLVVIYPQVRREEVSKISGPAQTQSSTHSWFLHHALGTGLVGVILIVGLALGGLYVGWRRTARADGVAGAAATVALITFLAQGTFSITHVGTEWLFWLSIGLVAAGDISPPHTAPAMKVDLVPTVAASALGVLLALTTLNALVASHAVLASNRARAQGDFAAAERLALAAVERDGGRADHWNVLGLARSRRTPELAMQTFQRAMALAPYDPVYVLNLAAEQAILGTSDPRARGQAVENVRSAAAMDPNGPATLMRAAEVLLFLGEPGEAAVLADRAIALWPNDAEYLEISSRVYQAAGDAKRAAALLLRSYEIRWPAGDVPAVFRLRLSQIYERSGDTDTARSLYRPPRVLGLQRCDVSIHTPPGISCLEVRFEVETMIVYDPALPNAVTRVETFALDGRPLPAGTSVVYVAPSIARLFVPGPVPRGARLEIRDLADTLGVPVRPNPVSLTVP